MCCLKYKTSPSKTRSTEKQNKAQTGRKGLRQHLCGCRFVCSQIIISWLVSRTGPAAAWGRSSACFTSYFWLWSESQPTGVGMGVAVASLCYLVGSACLRGFSDTRFLYNIHSQTSRSWKTPGTRGRKGNLAETADEDEDVLVSIVIMDNWLFAWIKLRLFTT